MSRFQVGDAVRLTGEGWRDVSGGFYGRTVVVGGYDPDGDPTFVDEEGYEWSIANGVGEDDWSATLVSAGIHLDLDVSKEVKFMEDVERIIHSGEHNAVNPNHYVFPGGHEVRHISAHLTSFGGQAVQYVSRATRLDGQNKGEAVEDLKKALRFIGWEIDRLEEETE